MHDGLGWQLIKARGPISRRVIVERQRALFVSVHLGSSRVVLSGAIIFIELCDVKHVVIYQLIVRRNGGYMSSQKGRVINGSLGVSGARRGSANRGRNVV